jgi:DNA replication protein DnaC
MADPAYSYDDVKLCVAHGWYRPFIHRGVEQSCFACTNDEREGRRTADESAAAEVQRTEKRLTDCGIVGRYRAATFASFEAKTRAQQAIVTRCQAFVRQSTFPTTNSAGLILIGPCGVGKTHLLAAMARDLKFERCLTAHLTTPRAIVRRLRATWAKGSDESEEEVLDAYTKCTAVLLLDEVGVGFGTDAELTQLFEVIDARYTQGLPTVAASNANLPALRAAIGDRIFDRLCDGAEALVLDWSSYRKLKA